MENADVWIGFLDFLIALEDFGDDTAGFSTVSGTAEGFFLVDNLGSSKVLNDRVGSLIA